MSCAVGGWRFAREFFEDAIELRERLKSNCKCDFTYPKITISQKCFRFFESASRDVIDKLGSRHLFELFAQVSRVDSDGPCDFAERKVLWGMLLDEFSCIPNVSRLCALPPFGEMWNAREAGFREIL